MRKSLKTKLKQLWFPEAFRLPEPEFTKDQLDLLEELIQLIQPTLSRQEQASEDERLNMARFLIDLGTGIWRIRRKIEGLSRMPKEIKDALYSLESTWASMAEGGVEIIDHTGAVPLKNEAKIIEVREIPNLSRDQVIETIKPTIMLKGEVIQLGEVIMGRTAAPVQAAPDEQKPDVHPAAAAETAENQTDAQLAAPDEDEPEITSPLLTGAEDSPSYGGSGVSDAQGGPEMPEELTGPPEIPETTTVPDADKIEEAEAPEIQEELPEPPKKKRASRKPKVRTDAQADETPKPKRTRRKKIAEEVTEVNDAG